MNFSPFGVPFTGSLPVGQFTTNGKFPQNISGQVVGVLQGGEGGVHYLRPVESQSDIDNDNGQQQQAAAQAAAQQMANLLSPTLITLPITMPGAKPGDPQQTVQIQVITGNPQPQKFQVAQLPIQAFQQGSNGGGAVLTVAYNGEQQNGVLLSDGSQGLPEGVTVVAAIQPHDLQLLQAGAHMQSHNQQEEQQNHQDDDDGDKNNQRKDLPITIIKQEHVNIKQEIVQDNQNEQMVNDFYMQRMQQNQNNSLINQYLKFTADTIKRESQYEFNPQLESNGVLPDDQRLVVSMEMENGETENGENGDKKKKKRYKKKPPKPKKPKPGQVHIATALDGTTLFCCPECHMAYPEKELLEQHLIGHKIERRFICDICGAGLKRKEHLERHKLGHNPDRPFICSVCLKGFKRKEHLNLHYVIHSGEKTEICGECGKGFYRKDHLRKHARSHAARRLKEEMQQAQAKAARLGNVSPNSLLQQQQQQQQQQQNNQQTQQHHLTIQVSNEAMEAMGLNSNQPSARIQVPVQIQVPQLHLLGGDDSNSNNVPTQIQVPVQIEVPQHHLQQVTGNSLQQSLDNDLSNNNSDSNPDQQVNTIIIPNENGNMSTVVLPTASETGGAMVMMQQHQQQQH